MRALIVLLLGLALGACTSVFPDKSLYITPTRAFPVEDVGYVGLALGVAYLVTDPLAPNWEIREAPLADNQVQLSLKMKRYYAGGAGEARTVFHRRAKDLVQYGGFDNYEVVEYNESLESSLLGSQRTCEGRIRLTSRSGEAGQGTAPPARMTPERATKPLS